LLLDPNVLGLVMTFAGVGEVVGGYVMGRLSDSIGRAACLALGASIYGVGLVLAAEMKQAGNVGPAIGGASLAAYFAALCFGLGDSCFNTNIYATVSQLYDKADADHAQPDVHEPLLPPTGQTSRPVEKSTHSAAAFTIFQFTQNVGSAVGYYYGLQVPLHGADGTLTQIWVQSSFLVVGLGSFTIVMTYFVKRTVK
jgi:MFS family permease